MSYTPEHMAEEVDVAPASSQQVWPWRAAVRTALQTLAGVGVVVGIVWPILREEVGALLPADALAWLAAAAALAMAVSTAASRIMAHPTIDRALSLVGLSSVPRGLTAVPTSRRPAPAHLRAGAWILAASGLWLVVELWGVVSRRSGDTLSEQVWSLMGERYSLGWWVLLGSLAGFLVGWLVPHFGWEWSWRALLPMVGAGALIGLAVGVR